MDLMDGVKGLIDKINRVKQRNNRELFLMSIINHLVEGGFDEHQVFKIISHYTINENDFNVKVVVELIKRYCLKKGVDKKVVLNELINFVEFCYQIMMRTVGFAKIDDEGLGAFGFDKTYGLRTEDYKTIFFHAVDAAMSDKSIDNDVYLFCRDNWQLINDVKGPILKKYFDGFVEKYNRKRLNRKEFLERMKQFTDGPTAKWIDGETQKVYDLKKVYKQHFEEREKKLFDELIEGKERHQ